MIIEIKVPKNVNVKYLKIDAKINHPEDAKVNGVCDDNCEIPFSKNFHWRPTIDLENGVIVDWPKGTTAEVYYKVVDEGVYTLLDNNKNDIIVVESYVPDFIGKYGDYISLNIDGEGRIKDFECNESDIIEMIDNAF